MTEDRALLQSVIGNPQDDATRLAYADWLAVRGDPRARFARAYPDIYRFIAGLKAAAEVYTPFGLLQGYAAAGRADLLYGLSLELRAHEGDARFNPRLPGVL